MFFGGHNNRNNSVNVNITFYNSYGIIFMWNKMQKNNPKCFTLRRKYHG